MIKEIKNWLKWMSLSNTRNWYVHSERGWSEEQDYTSTPRKFYRDKKYEYFITNAYIDNPLHISDLVNRFMQDYKTDNLMMGETYYTFSK